MQFSLIQIFKMSGDKLHLCLLKSERIKKAIIIIATAIIMNAKPLMYSLVRFTYDHV